MDRLYRVQRHVYDISRKYYLIGRDRMIAELAPPPGGRVLEIGCGTGRNLVAAAKRYPEAHFFGLDISREMLRSAESAVRRAGVSDRVTLIEGDATLFDPLASLGISSFDRVFASYSLSMIPPWTHALRHALALTAPGGALSVVEFGLCEGWPDWCRRTLYAWLAKFRVSPRETLMPVMTAAAAEVGATPKAMPLWRGYVTYIRVERPEATVAP
ncbi:MAG: class I SAM-dependent methyltransferase [Kiloniellales bacterium]|nr:class I SAM-dependent methyltransferase [Kiloniellales bacterium]